MMARTSDCIQVGLSGIPARLYAPRGHSSSLFDGCQLDVGIRAAAQPQGIVECLVGCAGLQPCRVDPAQRPGQVPARRIRIGYAHHHRRCAGAPVGTRVGEEVTLPVNCRPNEDTVTAGAQECRA